MINPPFDITVDYFAVLGVHHGASEEQVKKAYRRMARRFHPDVSRIHDAKEKFQEIAQAYEVLNKHRRVYCQQYEAYQKKLKRQTAFHEGKQASSRKKEPFHSQTAKSSARERKRRTSENQKARDKEKTQHKSDFFRTGKHRPIDGKDRLIEYPLTLRYAIRQLKIGSFYVPGLKVRMKFTREAFDGKTFRIPGRGYKGLFGGKDGDFLVRFQIRLDPERFELKQGDIYGRFPVPKSLLKAGQTVFLDTPSGRVDLHLPKDFETRKHFIVSEMGLPGDEEYSAGDLYVRLIPSSEKSEKSTAHEKM